MIVAELMTPDPVTATAATSVAQVWDLMRDVGVRHIPVVDRGALVGMVSDRDIAHLDLAAVLRLEGAELFRAELARPVVEVMSADVVAVEPGSQITDAIALLVDHKIGALPVVRGDSRKLVGILSYVDVLRAYRESLSGEK
jgi:acetoin utilization protein AcuB